MCCVSSWAEAACSGRCAAVGGVRYRTLTPAAEVFSPVALSADDRAWSWSWPLGASTESLASPRRQQRSARATSPRHGRRRVPDRPQPHVRCTLRSSTVAVHVAVAAVEGTLYVQLISGGRDKHSCAVRT